MASEHPEHPEHPEHHVHEEHTDQPANGNGQDPPSRASRLVHLGNVSASLATRLKVQLRLMVQGWQGLRPDLHHESDSPGADLRAALAYLDLRRLGLIVLTLLIIGYFISGFYTVQPGEVAVVRRFGKVRMPPLQDGLHYRLPWPIETESIVNVSALRRKQVGETPEKSGHLIAGPLISSLQVLSGDVNLVDFEIIVQYQVEDPVAYLFNLNVPSDQLVESAVQFSVTRLGGSMGIDELLTTERLAMQPAIRQEVQDLLDQYGCGLTVVSINLQKVYPSVEAAPAFRDVSSAREDKARAINEAEAYRNSVVPEARGEADSLLLEAKSQATVLVDQATGAAAAFNAIVEQYHTNSRLYGEEVTRSRLYLEQLEKSLPRLQTYVVEPGEQVNLRLFSGNRASPFPPLPTGR